MTCSTNCARSTWLRRASALCLALFPLAAQAAAPGVPARGGDVEQAWFRLTQALEPLQPEQLRERCDELLQTAGRLDLVRLTPLALALVAKARTLPSDQASFLLTQATRLDPGSPEAWFALASVQLHSGAIAAAGRGLARGLASLLADDRFGHLTGPGLLLASLMVFLVAFALWSLLAIRRVFTRLWHDLAEVGAHLRLGANGIVLTVLAVALPVFAGGDPVWLLLWLFALCWAYVRPSHKLVGAAGLLAVAAMPTLLELGLRSVTHPPDAIEQAASVLKEHRYEPQILDELSSLADLFGDDADFYRLLGDCYRQFGLQEAAIAAYREGLRIAPRDGTLWLALGSVQYLGGDYNAALQAFQAARDAGADPVVTNYDLSLAFAQTYHFHESDEAIAAAQKAGDTRLHDLTRGSEHQLIVVGFSRSDAARLVARKDPVLLLNRGVLAPPVFRERTLLHPLAIAGVITLVIAVGHFLLREHTTGLASACAKCGRPFCRRCKLSQESQSYCTQCINIFLKKDMVGIDAQVAKRQQLKRHARWLRVERRVSDLILPGLGLSFAGRPIVGTVLLTVAAFGIVVAVVWLPNFIAPALLHTSLTPLEAVFALLWLVALVTAQLVSTERS